MGGLTYDVVVVGAGGSGLAAAIEAATAGARVVVLEKGAAPGGSTGRSVGSIAASGTPDQRRLGIRDSPDLHFADYKVLSGGLAAREDPELVRLLVENVTGTLAWLRGLGLEFFGPVGEPPHTVPRLHNVLPGSRSYVHHLERRARQVGVTIETRTAGTRLIREGGRVRAVEARTASGQTVTFTARRAVVLTAGDFSANPDMKRAHIGEDVAGFTPVNEHATGDAQRMAIELGAQMLNAEVFDVPSMRLAPPPSEGLFGALQKIPPVRGVTLPVRWGLRHLPSSLIRRLLMGFVTTYLSPREVLFEEGAILVDGSGALRSGTGENINLTVAKLGEAGGYLIGDRKLFGRYSADPHYVATAPGLAYAYMPDFRRARRDVYAEAATLPELAKALGMDPGALTAAAKGGPSVPPFFALGPLRAYLIQTNGGLRVSPRLEVLTADGDPIPGLYAAGNAGQGGLALFGHGHHLGWAFTSGRIAGRNAAAS